MTEQTATLGGNSFVIVSEKDYRALQRRAEKIAATNRGDVAESRRRMREPGAKSLARIRKELAL